MPVAKPTKPAVFTRRVKHDFLVYPRRKLTNENIFALFESFGSMIADRDQVLLPIEGKGKVPAFPITREEMFQLYHAKDFAFGEDYRLFRRNPDTGAVTSVPKKEFQRVRNDPVVKAARQTLTAIVTAKVKKQLATVKS